MRFVVERSTGQPIEIEAERGEQDAASSRVTFYDAAEGGKPVGSFINVQGWYQKPASE